MLKLKLGKKKGAGTGDASLPVASDAESPDVEVTTKKKLPMLFIIIGAALVVLLGGGATAFLLMKPKSVDEAGEHAAPAKEGHGKPKEDKGGHGGGGEASAGAGTITSGPDGVTFYTLPDMIVNMQSVDGRPSFLKLKLTLEMKDADLATQLQGEAPRLQDMFQGFLRELRPEDLAGSAGSYQLRAEILRRVNLLAAPSKVDAVLIEEMLVQ